MWVCLLFTLVTDYPEQAIVVGLSNEPAIARRLAIIDRVSPFGAATPATQVFGALAGMVTPSTTTAAELRAKLDQADALEAEFHGDDASALREAIIDAYERSPIVDTAMQAAPIHTISPWSYVPFGIAQFKQHRPVVGAVFAAVTAGAVAWNIIASVDRDRGSHDDSRKGQFISAGVIAGAIVASVIEGVVHDYRDGDYP